MLAIGCTNRQSQMGVENLWRATPAPTFKKGRTTRSQVMEALGPPSQVIALNEQTLFYYLREQQQLKSFSLLVYNRSREQITYDRAIFFFDRRGVLEDFALSEEAIPRE
jgi:outer membrane protein assembly factor BamE (lipoprotein component of BamABCDE complex)